MAYNFIFFSASSKLAKHHFPVHDDDLPSLQAIRDWLQSKKNRAAEGKNAREARRRQQDVLRACMAIAAKTIISPYMSPFLDLKSRGNPRVISYCKNTHIQKPIFRGWGKIYCGPNIL